MGGKGYNHRSVRVTPREQTKVLSEATRRDSPSTPEKFFARCCSQPRSQEVTSDSSERADSACQTVKTSCTIFFDGTCRTFDPIWVFSPKSAESVLPFSSQLLWPNEAGMQSVYSNVSIFPVDLHYDIYF